MVVASFFWHGSSLSLYERTCLSSFVHNGFDVRVHSFNLGLELPAGTTLVDARALAKPEEIDLRTQDGQKGCLASFSNIYRYKMLSREAGWWFDTDVFCLADNEAFLKVQDHSPGISVGFESETMLNGAVLYVSETSFARDLEAMAEAKGYVIEWGAIGPRLLTEYYLAHPDRVAALPRQVFSPVPYSDLELLFDPEARSACTSATAGSLCVHLWNEIMRRRGIPKDVMPCAGSYLEALFASVGAESPPCARLPIEFIRLRREVEKLKQDNERLRLDFSNLTFLASLLCKLARPLLVLWRLGKRMLRGLTRLYSDLFSVIL